jgi:hypothetical protein
MQVLLKFDILERVKTSIPIGGLVAVGFDASSAYLLTVTHSGRGVFSTNTWERVARDYEVVYPNGGTCLGIGPIEGKAISVTEMDFEKGIIRLKSSDGRVALECESSVIKVKVH